MVRVDVDIFPQEMTSKVVVWSGGWTIQFYMNIDSLLLNLRTWTPILSEKQN